MRTKTLFIVNPISGIGKQKRIEMLIKKNLDHDLFTYDICYTERIHHGTELARNAADKGYECVVAVGGDGSVNDIVQGLRGTSIPMGIIPCGSGNGLAHTLKIPMLPWLAIRALNQRHEICIDAIIINDKHVSVNASGVGFDAYVSRLMQGVKTRGLSGYSNSIIRAYNNYESATYTLTVNGQSFQRTAWIIGIMNSNRIGYNFPAAPKAKLDDGLMDIDIIDKVPLDHLPLSVPLALSKHIELSQHVEMFRTSELTIEGNRDRWVDVDGEYMNIGTTLHFVNDTKSVHIFSRNPKQLLLPPQL